MAVRTLLVYQLTNNRDVTFYLFCLISAMRFHFSRHKNKLHQILVHASDNTSQIVFLGSVSQLKVLPLARKRSLTEADDNLILCLFAHSLNKTENLGQNILRLVKLPLRRHLEILTIPFKYLKFT